MRDPLSDGAGVSRRVKDVTRECLVLRLHRLLSDQNQLSLLTGKALLRRKMASIVAILVTTACRSRSSRGATETVETTLQAARLPRQRISGSRIQSSLLREAGCELHVCPLQAADSKLLATSPPT
jgi:hypothetical protein